MIGPAGQPGVTSLAEALATNTSEADRIFLKVDIEGSEYRLLREIEAYSPNIAGLVIEFHDFDLHRSRVENFIDAIPLRLAMRTAITTEVSLQIELRWLLS